MRMAHVYRHKAIHAVTDRATVPQTATGSEAMIRIGMTNHCNREQKNNRFERAFSLEQRLDGGKQKKPVFSTRNTSNAGARAAKSV